MMDVFTTNSNAFTSTGSTSVHNSPCHTPVSSKGGRVNTKSRAKGTQSLPQTPISNAGKNIFCLAASFVLLHSVQRADYFFLIKL